MSKTTTAMMGLAATLALTAPALAGPCTTAKFSAYQATGFSCTIGDKTFSHFAYAQNTSNAPTAANVTITPVGPIGVEEGFNFSGNWALFGSGRWIVVDVQRRNHQSQAADHRRDKHDSRRREQRFRWRPSESLVFPNGSTTTLNVDLAGAKHVKKVFTAVSSFNVTKDLAELAARRIRNDLGRSAVVLSVYHPRADFAALWRWTGGIACPPPALQVDRSPPPRLAAHARDAGVANGQRVIEQGRRSASLFNFRARPGTVED